MAARAASAPAEPVRVTVLEWPRFQAMFARAHRQGEHVALVGPTGGGKSTTALELAKLVGTKRTRDGRPSRVVVLGTKRRDSTLERLHRSGWPIIKEWPPAYGQEHCIVWPRNIPKSRRSSVQRAIFLPLLDTIDDEGGQTLVIDEAAYFERTQPAGLGMAATMEGYWSEARSNSVTMIACTQRPRNVSRLMWSEPSWIVVLRPEDDEDLKRVAELSGRKQDVTAAVDKLGGFEFLCIRRQRGGGRGLYVSRVDRAGRRA